MLTLIHGKFGPIYRTKLITVEVQCIYVNYAILGEGRMGWNVIFSSKG